MNYSTDLTEKQFEILDNMLPRSKSKPSVISRLEMLNAIFYQLKNGCQRRDLPKDFPKWTTVYSQFRRWKLKGVFDKALLELEKLERLSKEKKRST